VRVLATMSGMSENPISGGLNAPIAQWMSTKGRISNSISIAQGAIIGRLGRVSIRPDQGKRGILVGGQTHIPVEGRVTL